MRKTIFFRYSLLVTMTLLFVLITFSGCKKDDSAPKPPANEVYIMSSAFDPPTINVTVNTTVKWTNKEWVSHDVTSNTGLFDSGTFNVNGTFIYKFIAAGTYEYHCESHPTMTGKIIVN